MKKIILTLLALISLTFILTGCKGGTPEFTFELHTKDSYMVSVSNANNAKTIVVPDSYEGKPVTAIKQEGFANIKSVKEIIIPDSIEVIGNSAFANCTKLTRIDMGSGVKEIETYLSVYKENEGEVLLPDVSVDSIITFYPDTNFEGNITGITNVTFVPGDTENMIFSNNPFSGCKKLLQIEVDADNKAYKSIDGNLYTYDVKTLVQYATGKKDNAFSIPEGVESLDYDALRYCVNLKKITIPDSLKELQFSMLSMYMGDGLYFEGCTSLTEIKVSDNHPEYKSIDGNLYTKDAKTLLQYATGKKDKSFTVPDGVTRVEYNAFQGCDSLTKVTFSGSVSEIFSFPTNIAEITVDQNNTTYKSIDGVLYSNDGKTLILYPRCKNAKSYTTPDSVEVIDTGAFNAIERLETIVIGDSVKVIKGYAINVNSVSGVKLKKVSLGNGIESIDDRAIFLPESFKYNEYNNALYLGNDSNPYLLLAKAKDNSITSCSVNEKTKFIYASAFSGCKNLASVSIPTSVKSIGASAFAHCSSLKTVTIPKSITKIPGSIFYSCSALESIVIPDSVTEIGNSAFRGCSALKSVTIPDGVVIIGSSAFADCLALESVVIPDSVTEIGNSAFMSCKALKSVTIPDGVVRIGSSAFADCLALESVVIPDSVTEIGNSAFKGCKALKSVTIPDGVVRIGSSAFADCSALESVVIPDGVTTIENNLFSKCAALESVVIPGSVTEIKSNAFAYCTSLVSVIIPEGVEKIGSTVFLECSGLESVTIPSTVESIINNTFAKCNIKHVYFAGTEEEWIEFKMHSLKDVEIHYNYVYENN